MNLFRYLLVATVPALMTLSAQTTAVSPTIYPYPTREIGQPVLLGTATTSINSASPNLVEGREFYSPSSIAFDTSVTPPIMYVADTLNSRVLAFKNSSNLTAGNKADMVIGQVAGDFTSTLSKGPGTSLSTGLAYPFAVAVDSQGNLYVADTGNNRILRYPKPFSQTGSLLTVDLVIGQRSTSSGNQANQNGPPTAQTLVLSYNGNLLRSGLTFDSSGNLWVTDPGNNRVLMYPTSTLTANTLLPQASVVLGQTNFTTNSGPQGSNQTSLNKAATVNPSGLAFDASGNLYIADAYGRVLYYQGPSYVTGQSAVRVLGVQVQTGSTAPQVPDQTSLGSSSAPPTCVFTQGNNAYVCDTPQNRILKYDIPAAWSSETSTNPSPQALRVIGQNGFATGSPNQGQAQSNSSSLWGPTGGVFTGNTLWVVDSANNRVLGYQPSATGDYSIANIVVGQVDFGYNAPNLIEGKEVFFSGLSGGTGVGAAGMVIDKASTPPHLYVADTLNNRILGFKDARNIQPGQMADMVIGQPNFNTSVANYPAGTSAPPTNSGLNQPVGLVVDNNGNLYVADSGNSRVLRFPAPFNQPSLQNQTANLVLGQTSFTQIITDPSAQTMRQPWGLALFSDNATATPLAGSLAVSDATHNRVLIFKKQGSDFVSGEAASVVFGQTNFTSTTGFNGNSASGFNSPRHIASDTSDRLYVADSGNNRVMIFRQAPETTTNGITSVYSFGANNPQGVFVSSHTGEVWVTDTGNNRVGRFPEFTTLQTTSGNSTATINSPTPLALTLDANDNVLVAEATNRITFFYGQAFYRHAASYTAYQPLAPGQLAILGRLALPFSIQSASNTPLPWPTTLSDLNVTVNGTLAPIFATDAGYGAIFLQVPSNTPTSGLATVQVTQASTGQVLGVGAFQMNVSNPGFFTVNELGTGPVIALNLADNTLNNAGNGATRGSNVTFCLTGLGPVSNAPPDGQISTSSSGVPGPVNPVLYIQGAVATVLYSGLGCGFPGGWQINATIPQAAAPGLANSVVLTMNDIASNVGGNPNNNSDGTPGGDLQRITTTIWVK